MFLAQKGRTFLPLCMLVFCSIVLGPIHPQHLRAIPKSPVEQWHYAGDGLSAEILSDTTICRGDSLLLSVNLSGTGPFELVWTNGISTDTITGIVSSPFQIWVSPFVSTTYTFLNYSDIFNVTQPLNLSCSITLLPLPVVTIPPIPPTCTNFITILYDGLPNGGTWSGNYVFPSSPALYWADSAGAGTHPITYTYQDPLTGCANSAQGFIEVVPIPVFNISTNQSICKGDSILLEVTNPSTQVNYMWSTSDITSSVLVSPSFTQTYSVTVTETVAGCLATDHVVISVYPVPVVYLGENFDICTNGSALLNSGIGFNSYLWSTGATTPSITVNGATIGLNNTELFSLEVTNSFGCKGSGSIAITGVDCTDIHQTDQSLGFAIWPNPCNGIFDMRILGITGEATIQIMMTTGELVYVESLILRGDDVLPFNFRILPAGFYSIQLISNQGVVSNKLVVQ